MSEPRKMANAEIIVMKYLSSVEGQVLEWGGLQYTMRSGILLWRRPETAAINFQSGKAELVWVECPMTVSEFVSMCREIPREELFVLGANTTLNEMRREGRCTTEKETEL